MPDKARVAILVSGSGTNMAALLYASRQPGCPYEVVLVSGDKADCGGIALAEAEGVPVARLPKLSKDELFPALDAAIRAAGAEYIALAGFMRVLPADFVSGWDGRILNIHPSLLPRYKGLHTHERALAAGDSKAGASVHVVTAALDDGPLLAQAEVAVQPGDTAEKLAARVLIAEHQIYSRALAEYVSRPYNSEWLTARVGDLAIQMPEAEARTSHGSPGWKLAGKSGKFFAFMADRHHGDRHVLLVVKTSGLDELHALVEQQPEVYCKPAYWGAGGWIGLILDRPDLDWDHVRGWIERSWRAVAPARLTRLMNVADEF
ncbi:phosphoribosylglycinamide formyltransferase [Alteraurantiacibacter buctensis]|uniref:Phosphoribosylglycinamide formyltransferase n=1 Tax=Alteraurantiacibacter buctensis TaxID=1503981 RepID=A0A844YZ37_9SPHN|nr:phosphoribosylglycinamide formyltransferase [Alteraurantiacibacter buctensis]MXO72041.1 phosphoribosylglycinamide formyltransferase [Alteraurantiacibacter buctensis]